MSFINDRRTRGVSSEIRDGRASERHKVLWSAERCPRTRCPFVLYGDSLRKTLVAARCAAGGRLL